VADRQETTGREAAENKARFVGLLWCLASAAGFGTITACARLAYDAGSKPQTVIEVRYLAALAVLFCLLLWQGRSFILPRAAWRDSFLAGLGIFGLQACYMSSVAFIPVPLAALIFFTFPVIVAALAPITDKRPLRPGAYVAFLLAFAGLALALGPSLDQLDWRGLLLAAGASLSAVLLFLFIPRATRLCNELTVAFHTILWGTLLWTSILFLSDGLRLPSAPLAESWAGWLGLALAGVFFGLGNLFQFMGLRSATPTSAALVYNLEPLISILAAWLILGQIMTVTQSLGAALVLLALMLFPLLTRRRKKFLRTAT
jgi:drug/metabolite transporter (DMT)-like permease